HAAANVFAKDPFGIVQQHAIASGVGMPTYDPTWKRQAMNLSLQFHPPTVTTAISRVGFDADNQYFDTPVARINTATGKWLPIRAGATTATRLPATSLDLSGQLDRVVPALSDSGTQPVLAVVTAVSCQLLSDI